MSRFGQLGAVSMVTGQEQVKVRPVLARSKTQDLFFIWSRKVASHQFFGNDTALLVIRHDAGKIQRGWSLAFETHELDVTRRGTTTMVRVRRAPWVVADQRSACGSVGRHPCGSRASGLPVVSARCSSRGRLVPRARLLLWCFPCVGLPSCGVFFSLKQCSLTQARFALRRALVVSAGLQAALHVAHGFQGTQVAADWALFCVAFGVSRGRELVAHARCGVRESS